MKYEDIFTFENLYKSHLKARLSKRNKEEVINFELNTSVNIQKLYFELKYKKYNISGYKTFYIYEPKKRKIDALCYRDRIVEHCLCDFYMTPLLERRLIYDNAASRISKGTDFARKRLKKFYNDYYNKYHNNKGYVLKCDIHHFFDEIDHNILKNIMKSDVKDKNILNLLYKIIDSYNYKEHKGLPIGNQTSQAFAIRYLDEMDRMVKEKFKIKYYVRYMDDFILISHSKFYLKYILENIKLVLHKYNLKLNDKTKIYNLSESMEFLGFKYKMLENGKIILRLSSKKKKLFLQRIYQRRKMYEKK